MPSPCRTVGGATPRCQRALRSSTLLQRVLPHIPPAVLIYRSLFLLDLGIHTVAHFDRLARGADRLLDPSNLADFERHLVDYAVGGLSAAVSRKRG